jgi:hypothetical protein
MNMFCIYTFHLLEVFDFSKELGDTNMPLDDIIALQPCFATIITENKNEE